MTISVIAAVGAGNHVIGTETGLPWKLPADLARFRRLTMGKPLIMGRTTHEQIGIPLPGRTNIVLTHRTDYHPPGVVVAHTLGEALDAARLSFDATAGNEVMVIGGAAVYTQFLPMADRFYLTVVAGQHEGTTVFPMHLFDEAAWVATHAESLPADAKNWHAHRFMIYERARGTAPTLDRASAPR